MAQLVEQLIRNQQVAGSSPAISSKKGYDGFIPSYPFLSNENPAIVAGFYKGFADEQKTNKRSAENVLMSRLPCVKGAVSEAD